MFKIPDLLIIRVFKKVNLRLIFPVIRIFKIANLITMFIITFTTIYISFFVITPTAFRSLF